MKAAAIQFASTMSDEDLVRSSTFFDRADYLRRYPDVAAAGLDPVVHYLQMGAAEGRDPSAAFSTQAYLRANPDVTAGGLNPLVHYLRYGMIEGRDPHPTHAVHVAAASASPQSFAVGSGHKALLASSELFDSSYYLAANPDVASAGLDPIEHYLSTGAKEGRDPSEAFSTSAYLRRHVDVAAAGLNPLVHYLESGKAEGRLSFGSRPLVPTFAQLYEERWPFLKPIPVLHVPNGERRLTIVTDSIAPASLFGGVGTAMMLGAMVASRLGATLRIATRHEPPDGQALGAVLRSNGITFEGPLEFAFAPDDGSHPLPLAESDLFLTTSWWTTRAVLGAVPRTRVAYLLQEDERMFYPFDDQRLLCAETMNEADLSLVINTRLLSDHLRRGVAPLRGIDGDSVAFEPAFPSIPRDVATRPSRNRRKFFFYSRPNNGRNLFWRGAGALADAIEDGILDPEQWDFFFVGKGTPKFTLPRDAKLNIVEGLNWSEYQRLVAEMDAALVLMDTPHPSYPPLDLASAGVAVLTNTHPGKSDLSNYSNNILMAEPTKAGLREGLRQVAALGADDSTREQNRAADGICRNWEAALEGAVEWLSARYGRSVEERHVF